ncbi:MAG: hypothetical protein LBU64_11105 [Planctomycetota bacterium]|jgi:UDP-2,3-diacylglucosamine pyrophosphatase LpxH|nr:hypothetical protein [Planctomycetota bacterium]
MLGEERVYLLADMHLRPLDAPTAAARRRAADDNRRLAAFLSEIDGRPGQLVLLGDTFNFWFERRGRIAGDYFSSLRLFKAAADRGLAIHHVSGNRDYATGGGLGAGSAERHSGFLRLGSGVTLSRLIDFGVEPHGKSFHLRRAGKLVTFMHGDSLCSRDFRFMLLRRLLQGAPGRLAMRWSPWFLIKPAVSLIQAGGNLRIASRRPESLLDPAELSREIARGTDLLICGHVHARLGLDVESSGRRGRLEMLPAWRDGWYGVLEEGKLRVERFAPRLS